MRDNLAASTDHVERAATKTDVGLFVRSLVGVDMTDANDEFAGFRDVGGYNANQIDCISMIIDNLGTSGTVRSPSTAAMAMLGRTSNGRLEWKTQTGASLRDLQGNASDELTSD